MDLGVSWAMLAAAAVGFGVGAAWYGIFNEPWMRAVGKTRQELGQSAMPYAVAVITNLLTAFVLYNLMKMFEISGPIFGLIFAFLFWLGFAIPVLVMNNSFARRPISLTIIDGGHSLLNICLQGVVLGYFVMGSSSY